MKFLGGQKGLHSFGSKSAKRRQEQADREVRSAMKLLSKQLKCYYKLQREGMKPIQAFDIAEAQTY